MGYDKQENVPAPPDLESTSVKMLRQLGLMVRSYTQDARRVRSLVTFAARDHVDADGKINYVRFRSKVRYTDRPEVELYLEYRDMIADVDKDIARTQKFLDEATDLEYEKKLNAMETISRLRNNKHNHMQSMQRLLATMQQEFAGKESIMAKLASDGAKLSLAARVEDERRRRAGDEPGDAEVERIANG
jgi:hypothetical protein